MVQLEEIDLLLSYQCNYQHTNCKKIAHQLDLFYSNGGQVTREFLTSYLQYLTSTQAYHYDKCINQTQSWVYIFKKIIVHMPLDENDMDYLIFPKTGNHYYYQVDISGYIIELFDIMILQGIQLPTNALRSSLQRNNIEIANYLINHVISDSECLEAACLCPEADNLIDMMLSQKVNITVWALRNAVIARKENVVTIFIQFGILPTTECLENACKNLDIDIIRKILQCRVEVTDECFNALFASCGINYGKDKESSSATLVANIIDCLVANDYVVTYDNVFTALEHGCYINDVKRFNIQFDNEFIEYCAEIGYYPYTEADINIKPSMNCLYVECKRTNNLQNVKNLIAQGLVPNIECLQYACDNKTNLQTVRYLMAVHKIKPNIECIKRLASHMANATLTYIVEHFDDKIEDDNLIKLEEPPIVKETIIPINESISIQIIPDKTEYDIHPIEYHLKINRRAKYILKPEANTLFDNNIHKSTFTEARKLLLEYITTHHLIDQNRKDLIKPSAELCKILNMDQGKYVDFNDLDNVVCHLFELEN